MQRFFSRRIRVRFTHLQKWIAPNLGSISCLHLAASFKGQSSSIHPSSNDIFSISDRHHGTAFNINEVDVRTNYKDFSPFNYKIIDTSDSNSKRVTETDCELLVIPIYDTVDHKPDEKAPSSIPSNTFDFQVSKLDQAHGNLLSKNLIESQIFNKKINKNSKFKYCVARVAGNDLEHTFPKKVALVSMGKKPGKSENNTQNIRKSNLIASNVQNSKGLANVIAKILAEHKNIRKIGLYLNQTQQLFGDSLESLICSINLHFHNDARFKNVRRENHSYYEETHHDDNDLDDQDGGDNSGNNSDGGENSDPNKKKRPKKTITIMLDNSNNNNNNNTDLGQCLGTGVSFARELVNSPANIMTPIALSECVEKIAHDHSKYFKCFILTPEQCSDLNMNAFLKVGAASNNEPRFIHMTLCKDDHNNNNNNGDSAPKQNIALIGKGVTFDSGGYNLKAGAGSSIEYMKYDMAGSAAVVGTFLTLSKYFEESPDIANSILSKYNIHGCIAACENMISGYENAMHPGDVVQAADGTTIEVNNTDAEGRLTLCDAIWFAKEIIGANTIIDIATLTGAIKVAIGNKIAGLYSNSDELLSNLIDSGYETGERLWHMPLYNDVNVGDDNDSDCMVAADGDNGYVTLLDSEIADMKNSASGRFGGSITAALFLQKFAENNGNKNKGNGGGAAESKNGGKKVDWAHLDVAGPVWKDKKGMEMKHGGATGYGVRLLTHYVLSRPT